MDRKAHEISQERKAGEDCNRGEPTGEAKRNMVRGRRRIYRTMFTGQNLQDRNILIAAISGQGQKRNKLWIKHRRERKKEKRSKHVGSILAAAAFFSVEAKKCPCVEISLHVKRSPDGQN